MSLRYLLDGYNVLHQIPKFLHLDLADQRQKLIDTIARQKPQGHGSNRVVIVFDGKPGRILPNETPNVKAVFTQSETADDWIKREVSHSLNGKEFVVVTNDRAIQYAVRADGAKILKVEEFWAKCQPAKGSQGSDGPKVSRQEQDRITKEMEDIWLKKGKEEH